MKITIRAKGVELTPELEEYARNKVGKIEKYLDNVIESWVELVEDKSQKSGMKYYAEVQIKMPKGSLRATETTTDIHAAIDLLIPKLKKEIEKYKTKNEKEKRERGIKGLME